MTTSDDDRAYKVGYGKPPKHSRFKKGQSGNPKGRPKGAKNISTILHEQLFRPMTIKENGRPKQIPLIGVIFRLIGKSALEGDSRSQDRVIRLLSLAATGGSEGDEVTASPDMDVNDEAILRHFIETEGPAILGMSDAAEEEDKE